MHDDVFFPSDVYDLFAKIVAEIGCEDCIKYIKLVLRLYVLKLIQNLDHHERSSHIGFSLNNLENLCLLGHIKLEKQNYTRQEFILIL